MVVAVVSASPQRIQGILNNLEISFIECTFICTSEGRPPSKEPEIHSSPNSSSARPTRSKSHHQLYAPDHNHHERERTPSPNRSRRRSTLASIQKFVQDTASDLYHDAMGTPKENPFVDCIFPPGEDEAEAIKAEISSYTNESTKFKFKKCIFIRREYNWFEDLVRLIRKFLGIKFDLYIATGVAEVRQTKHRLNDLPWIIQIVVEQVQEDFKK